MARRTGNRAARTARAVPPRPPSREVSVAGMVEDRWVLTFQRASAGRSSRMSTSPSSAGRALLLLLQRRVEPVQLGDELGPPLSFVLLRYRVVPPLVHEPKANENQIVVHIRRRVVLGNFESHLESVGKLLVQRLYDVGGLPHDAPLVLPVPGFVSFAAAVEQHDPPGPCTTLTWSGRGAPSR